MSNEKRTIIKTIKDDSGAYLKPTPPEPLPELALSVDKLLMKGLLAIDRTLAGTLKQITACGGVTTPDREAIQNLKDCMAMLKDLRDLEKELLEELTDDELAERARSE